MRPFSTKTLAERWTCSPQHIRDLIASEKLRAFRIGSLLRISYAEVLRIESCDLEFTEANTVSTGEKKAVRFENRFEQATRPWPNKDSDSIFYP